MKKRKMLYNEAIKTLKKKVVDFQLCIKEEERALEESHVEKLKACIEAKEQLIKEINTLKKDLDQETYLKMIEPLKETAERQKQHILRLDGEIKKTRKEMNQANDRTKKFSSYQNSMKSDLR